MIAEVSVGRRFEGSYTFAEFVALMAAREFELCDVLNVVKDSAGDVSHLHCAFRRRPATSGLERATPPAAAARP